eukprot:TRINITY_DN1003_c0_g1_i5.p1 TRINITY_DN1003_c0_g1~~TRINITY_DN1003_c0_g1_i5.p1  ORF type:complete len:706 (-),score=134.14 TRINITY_DN1003_c0_g1_i5:369-2486(-)
MDGVTFTGWRASSVSDHFAGHCWRVVRTLLDELKPKAAGGVDFLSVNGAPMLTDINFSRFNGCHFPKLFLELYAPNSKAYIWSLSKPSPALSHINIETWYRILKEAGLGWVPQHGDTSPHGVFPVVFLSALRVTCIAVADNDSDADQLHLAADALWASAHNVPETDADSDIPPEVFEKVHLRHEISELTANLEDITEEVVELRAQNLEMAHELQAPPFASTPDSRLPVVLNSDFARVAVGDVLAATTEQTPTEVVIQVAGMLSAAAEVTDTHSMLGSQQIEAISQAAEVLTQTVQANAAGMVELEMHFESDSNDPKEHPVRRIIVPSEEHLKYRYMPTYLPKAPRPNQTFEGPADEDIIFMNAQNLEYYARTLERPVATIWGLTSTTELTYSSKRLIEEAFKLNIVLKMLAADQFELVVSNTVVDGLMYQGGLIPLPDAVICRFGATIDYGALALLRQLELLDVEVLNGVDSIEISRDKMYTHQVLSHFGIPIPKSVLGKLPDLSQCDGKLLNEQHLSYPMIVKCLSGSMGDAVWKVDSLEDLTRQEAEIRALCGTQPVVFQKFVSSSAGRDLRIIVANGKIVSAMMRIASTGFKANFHQGGRVRSVSISPQLAEMAIRTARLCKLDIAGVDVLMDRDGGYVICEVNSSPGFEGMERASRVNVARELVVAAWDKIQFHRMSARLLVKFKEPKELMTVPLEAEHLN